VTGSMRSLVASLCLLLVAGCTVEFDESLLDRVDGPAPDAPAPDMFIGDGPQPLGYACTADADCASAHCVDGVCCKHACAGECYACNVKGSLGQCVVDEGAPCGTSAICVNEEGLGGEVCDATGSCVAGPMTQSCEPYKCDSSAGACFTSCADDTRCYQYKCDVTAGTCFDKCTSTETHCQSGFTCNKGGKCR
jgi:hypothetical protein